MSKYYYEHDKITDDTVITDGDYKYHWQSKKRTFTLPALDGPREYKLNDICDLVNNLEKKNQELKKELAKTKVTLNHLQSKYGELVKAEEQLLELLHSSYEENTNIKKAIEDYIKDYEIYDDFDKHHPRSENHTVKHLSYCDMRKHVNDTVIGVLNHLKESYSCPQCGSSKQYFTEVTYGRFNNPKDCNVYEKRECMNCNYNEIIKRPEYKYNEEDMVKKE